MDSWDSFPKIKCKNHLVVSGESSELKSCPNLCGRSFDGDVGSEPVLGKRVGDGVHVSENLRRVMRGEALMGTKHKDSVMPGQAVHVERGDNRCQDGAGRNIVQALRNRVAPRIGLPLEPHQMPRTMPHVCLDIALECCLHHDDNVSRRYDRNHMRPTRLGRPANG